MALSNELLSEFAKITNDQQQKEKKDTAYGTIKKQGNQTYVKLDGSDNQLTPCENMVTVKDGDRVKVTIENHRATILGNLSDPSYSSSEGNKNNNKILEIDSIISHTISTDEIHAIRGFFEQIYAITGKYDNLEAINAKIEKLEAMYADVDHLNAKDIEAINATIESLKVELVNAGYIQVNDLDAIRGHFEQLQAYNADFVYVSAEVLRAIQAKINSLQVEELLATYAKIDLANITEAAIDNLKANLASIDFANIGYAAIEKLKADFADIDLANISQAAIDSLNAKYATIDFANINEAAIKKLKADFADIDFANISVAAINNLKAKMVDIDFATINKATIDSLDAKYANIDFANIGEAAVEKLFAKSGIIKDLITQDGHITGELVGVTIKGDLIEAGTLVADKLVIRGQNGLFYKLNLEGLGKDVLDQIANDDFGGDGTVFEDGLHGSTIIAHSITADRINVSDLVAFNATIGGFNITEDSIYSGVKESIDNTTTGLYMDNKGQFSIGDGLQYLKYYKDSEGNYKLEITANSILFKTGNKTIEEVINELNDNIKDSNNIINKSIKTVDTLYAKNNSYINVPTNDWSYDIPTWENGYYIWSKTIITYNDDTTKETSPVCITGAKGDVGPNGKGISDIEEEYYMSSSESSLLDGNWENVMPPWNEGEYLWIRQHTIWSDGTTTYSTPYLAGAINTANEQVKQLEKTIHTELQSTKDGWEMNFDVLETQVKTNKDEADQAFNEISKYIRFENGNIVLRKRRKFYYFTN